MSLAALPGGGGGVSTHPWNGMYRDLGRAVGDLERLVGGLETADLVRL